MAHPSEPRFGRWLIPIGTLMAATLLVCCKKSAQQAFQEGMEAYAKGDFSAAMEHWRPLADAGDASAQTNVGLLYSQGKGVKQDAAEAFKWYKMAAMQNYSDAQYNLGIVYREGKGVDSNLDEAIRWFQHAAESGHVRAALRLGEIYRKGAGGKANARQAIQWFEMAAEKGEPHAQAQLGEIYAQGEGVPVNRIKAYFWFSAATAQQDDDFVRARAGISRMRLMSQMDEVELAEGERQAEEWREARRTEANR